MNVLRVGRYRVLQHLGGGGSSEVYLAEDTFMRRKVALKVLRRRDANERELTHFDREVRCASMINHPNIVTVLDVGSEGDVRYIASEYVDGETLRRRMQQPMEVTEVLDVAIGVSTSGHRPRRTCCRSWRSCGSTSRSGRGQPWSAVRFVYSVHSGSN